MSGRRAVTAVAAVLAPALLAATRLPADGPVAGIAALAFGLAAAAVGLLAAWRPRWQWTAPVGLAAGIGLLAIPASRSAVAAGIPAAFAALPILLLFHVLYPLDGDSAPRLGAQRSRWARAAARLAPFAAGLAFLAVFPWLVGQVMPSRVAAVRELAGPASAVVAALLVAMALGSLALARGLLTALRTGRRRSTDAEVPSPPPSIESEGTA